MSGAGPTGKPFEDLPIERWQDTLRGNLEASREPAAEIAERELPARESWPPESAVSLSSPAESPAAFPAFATMRPRRSRAARAPSCSTAANACYG